MRFYVTILLIAAVYLFTTGTMQAQSLVPEKNQAAVKVRPVAPVKAYAFNISDVRLLQSPFSKALTLDSAYLMLLRPNRLLHRFHKNAGLPVKDSVYGGWESEGLSGHTLGHYLSAMAMLYAATGQPVCKQRTGYIINELEQCAVARKTGYIGAIPNEDEIFGRVAKGDIKTGGFDLNGGWSPWYTVHKLMAGLCDVYLYTGNKKALQLAEGMAGWTWNTVYHLPDSLRLKMLNCEWGGMNDVLANIYSFTGNKKWLELSYKFYDEFVMGRLARQDDPMPGKHSNTNVPKAIGSARQYELTGNRRDSTIAHFFWQRMVRQHSYVIGGNSNYEYCGEPGQLNDRLSDNTCETCNTYNMLKLTRHLFAWQPSAELMDYYERALYNHILASQHPETGMMCYFVPLRMGAKKQFSDSFSTFTCCVGSGMENHVKYAEQVYSHNGGDVLYVNLFIPSRLEWKARALTVTQETAFPQTGEVDIVIDATQPVTADIRIRLPHWARGNTRFQLLGGNGQPVYFEGGAATGEGYYSIRRRWIGKMRIRVMLPMELYTEAMPDNPNRVAIKYGPLVLAGQLGAEKPDPVYGVPVLLTEDRDVKNWIRLTDTPLRFQAGAAAQPFGPALLPFYQTYSGYYNVYWDYFTRQSWDRVQQEYEEEKKRQRDIEERTVDELRLGEMQPERDHRLTASERSYISDAMGRNGREARADHYFAFDMKLDTAATCSLLLTCIGDDKDRVYDVLVNDRLLVTVNWPGGTVGKFYDVEYPLPPELVSGRRHITIKIEANRGKTAGRIFSARIVRKR